MKNLFPGAALLLLCPLAPCRAQNAPADPPAPEAAAQPQTPEAAAPVAPDGVPPVVNRQQRRALSPGQQRKLERNRRNREMMEARLRALMSGMGFTDGEVQTEIIEHIAGEERAMAPVRTRARALLNALSDPATPPDRVSAMLAELRDVLEADRLRRKEAQIVLDDKIDYSHQPRLAAFLTLLGVLGDGPSFVLLRPQQPATFAGDPAYGDPPRGGPSRGGSHNDPPPHGPPYDHAPPDEPPHDAPPAAADDAALPDTAPQTPDDLPATPPEEKR